MVLFIFLVLFLFTPVVLFAPKLKAGEGGFQCQQYRTYISSRIGSTYTSFSTALVTKYVIYPLVVWLTERCLSVRSSLEIHASEPLTGEKVSEPGVVFTHREPFF